MADVAVIGAGALGMVGARRLAAGGARVTVFEREPQAGGLTAGFKVGQNWLDKLYHHLFRTDRRMIALFEELGLGDRIWLSNHRTDVEHLLRNADVLVLPSFHEALPRVVVEAMLNGVAVIASPLLANDS